VSALPVIGFVAVAALAVAFAVVPLIRLKKKKQALLLAAIALFMLGIGGGTYLLVGRPHLARRAAEGIETRDVNGLVPFLIQRVRKYPTDAKAWRYLSQAYMTAGDSTDAAKAMAKVIALTGKNDPALDASYGEALVQSQGGQVSDEAFAAFTAANQRDPKNPAARFFLGLGKAQRGDRPGAIALWQSLLADVPANSPVHDMLIDRLAQLRSQQEGAAPNPRAMVAMLAARLKADPNDALGWVRLIHAYNVLGETDEARKALATARAAFKTNKDAQTAFDTIAKEIK
jgi:cytochrome c-type biogenesis protein CcmH